MKIVIDARMWNETGIGRYIRNLVLGLEKIDSENDYYLLLLSNEFNSLQLNKNFHKVLANFKWYTLEEQYKLPFVINKISPDLFHSPNINAPVFYSGKMVITIHDLIMLKGLKNEGLKHFIKRVLLKVTLIFLLKSQCKVVTVSNYVKRQLQLKFNVNPEDIKMIYNCVDVDSNLLTNPTGKSDYLLYVGNTYGHKNIEFLINAVSETDKRLIIVGKEDVSVQHLKQIVLEKRLENKVHFRGYVEDFELNRLYSNAFAFIFPTLDEGFGLPGLEAMSNSCPVICTDIEVLREIYKDGAVYFEKNSTKSLVAKIKMLESTSFRERLLKNGLEVVKQYSCKSFVENTLKVYLEFGSYK